MSTVDLQGVLERRAQVEAFQRKHRIGLLTLLFTDIVGSTKLKQRFGDAEGFDRIQEHHDALREILRLHPEGEEISTAGDSFFIVFAKPSEAVKFALALQHRLREMAQASGAGVFDRVGIHIGEVIIDERPGGPKPKDLYGIQVDICARVMSAGEGDQVLMTRSTFDNARQVLKGKEVAGLRDLVWLNHGAYALQGVEEPLEICEVGEEGLARLRPPPDSEKVRRFVSAGDMGPAGAADEVIRSGAGRSARKWGWAAAASVVLAGAVVAAAMLSSGRANHAAPATQPASVPRPAPPPDKIVEKIGFEPGEGYVAGKPLLGQQGWQNGGWKGQTAMDGQGVGKGLFGADVDAEGQHAYIGGVAGVMEAGMHASLGHPLVWSPASDNQGVVEIAWRQLTKPSTNGAGNLFAWLFYNKGGQFLFGVVFDNQTRRIGRRFADNSFTPTRMTFRQSELTNVKVRIDFRRNNWSATVGADELPPVPLAMDFRQANLGSIGITWRSQPGQAQQPGGSYSGDNVMVFDDITVTSPKD